MTCAAFDCLPDDARRNLLLQRALSQGGAAGTPHDKSTPTQVPNTWCSSERGMAGTRMRRAAHVVDILDEESLPDGTARSWFVSGS